MVQLRWNINHQESTADREQEKNSHFFPVCWFERSIRPHSPSVDSTPSNCGSQWYRHVPQTHQHTCHALYGNTFLAKLTRPNNFRCKTRGSIYEILLCVFIEKSNNIEYQYFFAHDYRVHTKAFTIEERADMPSTNVRPWVALYCLESLLNHNILIIYIIIYF